MNPLYEAVIALGRSITSIDRGEWTKGTIGGFGTPSCGVGLITKHTIGRPLFLTMGGDLYPRAFTVVELASDALRRSVSAEAYERAVVDTQGMTAQGQLGTHVPDMMRRAYEGGGDIADTQCLIVRVNDSSNAQQVREWFSDALDLLAEDLPVPATPVVPAAADALSFV